MKYTYSTLALLFLVTACPAFAEKNPSFIDAETLNFNGKVYKKDFDYPDDVRRLSASFGGDRKPATVVCFRANPLEGGFPRVFAVIYPPTQKTPRLRGDECVFCFGEMLSHSIRPRRTLASAKP